MWIVHAVSTFIRDLLFPPETWRVRLDHLDARIVAETATGVWVHRAVHCIAPLPFDHALVRTVVHAAKYRAHERSASILGDVLSPFVAEELAERRMAGMFETAHVVPVPLHATRLNERGFNQSERIARALVTSIGDSTLVLTPHLLTRTRHTETQTKQARHERITNMRDAFAVTERNLVHNANIILVDDVITTGATLRAATRALEAAGARSVLCVAAAQ